MQLSGTSGAGIGQPLAAKWYKSAKVGPRVESILRRRTAPLVSPWFWLVFPEWRRAHRPLCFPEKSLYILFIG